jgi:uncharacterized membrane protein YccC
MASAFWQTVTRFDKAKIAPEIALRNTIGIIAPLIWGTITDHAAAGAVASLGALNVCYSDSRDAYIVRGKRMLLASVLVGAAVIAGALSARHPVAAVLTQLVWAFGAGMLVVLGAKAADLAVVTLVTLIIFGARPTNVQEAFLSGLLALAGGVLQTLLSVLAWAANPYAPEQRIVAGLYEALAEAAIWPAGATAAPPASAAVVNARESLASLDSNPSDEAARLIFLLEQGERIRLSLLTLRRLAHRLDREPSSKPAAAVLLAVLRSASGALKAVGSGSKEALAGFRNAAARFREVNSDEALPMTAAFLRDATRHVDALHGQLRAVYSGAPPQRAVTARARDALGRRARLVANLSFRSMAFRHAVRLALAVAGGSTLASGLHLGRPYWLAMTVAIVLKPDFVTTFSRGILRIVGTLIGLAIATAAVHVFPSSNFTTAIVLLAAFSLMLRWIGSANYGIFVVAVSGIIVLLVAMTGVNPKDAVAARAINTMLGGAIAAVAYWVWPTKETKQAGTFIGDMLISYRRYIEMVMSGPSSPAARAELHQVGNAGRIARSNAEASAARLAAEPGVPVAQRTLLNEILINTNRFIRAVMALEADFDGTSTAATQQALRGFIEAVSKALTLLAEAMQTGEKPTERRPDVRAAWSALERTAPAWSLLVVETDRVATSLNTLWEQVEKWLAI